VATTLNWTQKEIRGSAGALTGFLGDIVLAPTSAFTRLPASAGWMLPLALVCTATVVLGLVSVPLTIAVVERVSGAAIDGEIVARLERWLMTSALVRAAWVALKTGFICWVLWLTLALKDHHVSVRQLMVIAAYASFALVAEEAMRVGVVWLRGVEQIHGPQDLQSFTGIDAFIRTHGMGRIPKALLAEISLFSIWFITLIRGGLIGLAGLQRRTATVAAVVCWTYLLVLQVGIALVISNVLGTRAGG
jgi:hypothetical protein